jgi:hypothetical protein
MKEMMQQALERITGSRKSMLTAASVLALALLALAFPAPEAQANRSPDRNPPTLAGTWRTEVENPPPGFVSYQTFTEAGGTVEINQRGPTTGLGTWKRIGAREYLSTFYKQVFDLDGTLVETTKVRQLLTLSHDGNELTGTANVDIYDPVGNLVFSPITPANGAFRATRVVAEPLTF